MQTILLKIKGKKVTPTKQEHQVVGKSSFNSRTLVANYCARHNFHPNDASTPLRDLAWIEYLKENPAAKRSVMARFGSATARMWRRVNKTEPLQLPDDALLALMRYTYMEKHHLEQAELFDPQTGPLHHQLLCLELHDLFGRLLTVSKKPSCSGASTPPPPVPTCSCSLSMSPPPPPPGLSLSMPPLSLSMPPLSLLMCPSELSPSTTSELSPSTTSELSPSTTSELSPSTTSELSPSTTSELSCDEPSIIPDQANDGALLARFIRMKKAQVPEGAIKQAMIMENLDPALLFPNDNVVECEKRLFQTAKKASTPEESGEEDPSLAKFRKMLKMDLPEEAVMHAMRKDGVDPKRLFPNYVAPAPTVIRLNKPIKTTTHQPTPSSAPILQGKTNLKKVIPRETTSSQEVVQETRPVPANDAGTLFHIVRFLGQVPLRDDSNEDSDWN